MKTIITTLSVAACFSLAGLLVSCAPPEPPVFIEQHDVTVVQPKPKPAPKRVYREPAPEEFRAVTTPN